MTGYTVTEIEDAIIATLKADNSIGQYVKIVDRLPIEDRELVKKLVLQYPALLVIYTGGTDDTSIYPMVDHNGKFAIWCIDKNVRKISDASIGVYQMLNDVLFALHGQKLGLDIISTISKNDGLVDADKKVTIYSRDFEIVWRYQ